MSRPKPKGKQHHIACVFDTETTNIETDEGWRAFPILYIFNDIRYVSLRDYEPNKSKHERISMMRDVKAAVRYIKDLIDWGKRAYVIPVICCYNMMFDLQSLLYLLAQDYEMNAIAQSSTNGYCIDLLDDGAPILRFWDTFHLEMGGLAAMGRTCGLAKAMGDWDYDLVRTPETKLTEDELHYAAVDVQVIPAYLRYLLEANDWLKPSMFGCQVLTKTSLVRQMAKAEIGKLKLPNSSRDWTLAQLMNMRCMEELPEDYASYALRKACFRGGFTFTAAQAASKIVRNVHSIDVTSMHHTYINGRRIPIKFIRATYDELVHVIDDIVNLSTSEVLSRYDFPFPCAIHAKITFTGLRLKRRSAFSAWHIGLLAHSKFGVAMPAPVDYDVNALNEAAEAATRSAGWHDSAVGATFAFGKLMSAERCSVFVSEVELWNIAQVYEWDNIYPEYGEVSINSTLPPDYVTLQSNILYERKDAAKRINNTYHEGQLYKDNIPPSIPEGIADGLKGGDVSNEFFTSWYETTVKGSFNGIYGTQAMDVFRPDFLIDDTGDMLINSETKVTPENYEEKKPARCMVLYTYGLRIVAGSRQHLVIALQLLYERFGKCILVTGGDTDSIKVSTPADIEPCDLLETLKPLEDAIDEAISTTMSRVRTTFPQFASKLEGVGHFDYEETADYHYEAWNKARVSFTDGKAHITCAGLMRPAGAYHIEHWINNLVAAGHKVKDVLPWVLGYRGLVEHSICHALEHYRPSPSDVIDVDVTDYKGDTAHVHAPECLAIYPAARELGGITKKTNQDNINYLINVIGRKPEMREHIIDLQDGKPALWVENSKGDLVRKW